MRDRALGSTVRIYFTTHTLSTGVVVAPSSAFVAADFKIYKNGSATEKATTNGITVTSPFDSVAGTHLIEIDTSNATGDSGFWAVGSEYRVVMSTAKTVDSKNPSGICVGEFSLELQTGGDATLAKQEEILDAIGTYVASVTAVDGSSGTIVGFPSSLIIGNSYTADGNNDIHVFIRDENDDPITSVGTHDFTDPDFSCDLIVTNSGNAGRVRATVTYVDPGAAESYLRVEIPLSESSRAATGAATMQCTLKWDGVAKTIATQTVTWVARI